MAEGKGGVSITVWDTSAEPSGQSGLVYRWNGYAERDSVYSLLRYVEASGERLRGKYLAWIHELGESRIHGKRLIDHLAFGDGLSYWWMTPIVEKNPWKSPSIIDAIRFLALEEIVVRQRPREVRLVSGDRRLHLVLEDFCRKLGIAYKWDRLPEQAAPRSVLRVVYRGLPQPVQMLASAARHVWVRWPLRQADRSGWFAGDRALFFCSYFFHLATDRAREGYFHSHYWEGLHGLMKRMGIVGNWLQLFEPHDAVPDPKTAMDWTRHFNQRRHEQGFHTFLDAHLSWRVLWRALSRWFDLAAVSRRLGEMHGAYRPGWSRLSLWPLMREEWCAATRGPVAAKHLLWVELFDEAMRNLPRQKIGLYLCENQAWERAFIHAWRKHGHGRLIAVAHSTVRFWDLRYFTDQRTVLSPDAHPMPQPDAVALNGRAAIDAYLSVDYPADRIVECEALRYGHLNEIQSGHAPAGAGKGATIRVLILTDYMRAGTTRMLQMLETAVSQCGPATYTLKPHPRYTVEAADYPSLHLSVVTDPLGGILRDFDLAYSSNNTSAAVDAHLAGLPVVVMLDEADLNFSPLRNLAGVRFVSTPDELAAALQAADRHATPAPDHGSFFFLDPELPRWKRLLEFNH